MRSGRAQFPDRRRAAPAWRAAGRRGGASPYCIAARRSGPNCASRPIPAARPASSTMKPESSERFIISITCWRGCTSRRRSASYFASKAASPGSSSPSIRSAACAASRSDMLRPCAPMGGTTWAASPTRIIRFRAKSRATSPCMGNSLRGPMPETRPSAPCVPIWISAASSSSESAISSAARCGRSIHTRAERFPGIGTVVKGPACLWCSVEIPSCGPEWAKLVTSAVCS